MTEPLDLDANGGIPRITTSSKKASPMTDRTLTPSESFAAHLLAVSIEASIRCSKAQEPRLTGYHAHTAGVSWAAYRLIDALRKADPTGVDQFVASLVEEIDDGEVAGVVGEHAEALGVDVDRLVERVEAEYETATTSTS
jgi:hypothetical protein